MKVVGLVTEYNPFHNGHTYHLNKAKELTNADYAIAIMSGNFLQRGAPAFINKFARTQMALENGVDAVIELPLYYAVSSAEYFAKGAVNTFAKLNCIDYLCFGMECDNIHKLSQIANVIIEEPGNYKTILKESLKKGYTFPLARTKAIIATLGDEVSKIISTPNNILAIEYIKAIKESGCNITPIGIKRINSQYHDETIYNAISSASAIRSNISKNSNLEQIGKDVSTATNDILEANFKKTFPIEANDFSNMLYYSLLTNIDNLNYFYDIGIDLSRRIKNNINKFESFDQFAQLIKSKQLALTKINRSFSHIMLNLSAEQFNNYINDELVYYARILGFRKDSSALLRNITDNSSIPVINKLAKAKDILSTHGKSMLNSDLFASEIYNQIVYSKYNCKLPNEYKQSVIIK